MMVAITVEPINKPEQLSGMFLFVFTEKKGDLKAQIKVKQGRAQALSPAQLSLADEVKVLRAELIATRENMQTSQEELKSMNEEMLSANEELQSTNEELSTAKEEMQSLNEELQTVNQELQGKLDELERTSDDMKNLLNSTEIATLFLDDQLNIRRFTKTMSTIIRFIPIDKGRPFTDISSPLNYPELRDDALSVLDTLVFKEKQISTTDNRWFLIRIMPYCTQKNRIDGLVITFIDVTLSKRLELKLLDVERRFMVLFKQMPKASLFLNKEGTISMANPAAERLFKLSEQDMVGKTFKELDLGMVSEDGAAFSVDTDPFALAFSTGKPVKGILIGIVSSPDRRYQWMLTDLFPQFYEGSAHPYFLYAAFNEAAEPQKK